MSTRTVAVNEIGRRVGGSHHNAKLANSDVDLLLALHVEGWGYRRLAAKFEVSKRHVRDIIHHKRRVQVATDWRAVRVTE